MKKGGKICEHDLFVLMYEKDDGTMEVDVI